MISRATVYNTLNLFVKKGLLRQFVLNDGNTVFDANVGSHHHFVDEASGRLYDIPWEALAVSKLEALSGFEVREYHVVVRGRVKEGARRRA
jgi:Fe2+ or Zn2+ uptake regulation protein